VRDRPDAFLDVTYEVVIVTDWADHRLGLRFCFYKEHCLV
jgi:hypothetical protein